MATEKIEKFINNNAYIMILDDGGHFFKPSVKIYENNILFYEEKTWNNFVLNSYFTEKYLLY